MKEEKRYTQKFNKGDIVQYYGYGVSCEDERTRYGNDECPVENDERFIKVGEKYKVVATHNTDCGFWLDIQGKSVKGDPIVISGVSSSNFTLIKTNKMNKLTTTLKRILSKNLQAQYKAGFRNGDIELTEQGKQELLEILAQEKEEELTKIAKEVLAEKEEKI